MTVRRVDWATLTRDPSEGNACRNTWIRDMETMGQDTPDYLIRLALIKGQEAARIAAIEGQK